MFGPARNSSSVETPWRELSGELGNAREHDFERLALPFLRVHWPGLLHSEPKKELDSWGIDFSLPIEGRLNHYAVVVQAKGFYAAESMTMGQWQTQVRPSLMKFKASRATCDTFVFLHNRDSRDRIATAQAQEFLEELVSEGKARKCALWDRQTFVRKTREALHQYVTKKIRERSQQLLWQQQRIFRFGERFVNAVPLRRTHWKPRHQRWPHLTTPFATTAAPALLAGTRDVRYTLLVGSFGVGKTITTLKAGTEEGMVCIHIPAHSFTKHSVTSGTHALLGHMDEELGLFEDHVPQTAQVLKKFVGAALGRLLKEVNSRYLLVIDGLDENRELKTPDGLVQLTNSLKDLRCSIILTARKEHVDTLSGSYQTAFEELSTAGGTRKPIIEILELGPWTHRQARDLIGQVARQLTDASQRNAVRRIRERLGQEEDESLFSHPLLLQMMIDLAVDGDEENPIDEARLIDRWIEHKIRRDLRVPRTVIPVGVDSLDYANAMVATMREIAARMRRGETDLLMRNEINQSEALQIARDKTGFPMLDAATFVETSLMIPTSRGSEEGRSLRFFHPHLLEHFGSMSENDQGNF